MPGQYEAGPIALPGRGPVITPNRGQLIGRQPLVAATMPPGFIGPEMPLRGMVAGGLATREQPSMVAATVAAAGSMGRAADASEANTAQAKEVWESIGKGLEGRGRGIPLGRQMVAADISKKEILKSFLGEAGDIRKAAGIEAPSGRSPAESQALRFGYVAAASERVRGGGTTDVEERMQQLRVSTAGAASFETARTPRGAAAVLGQLLGGGGLEFKRRQAELQAATTQWRARANEVVRLETDVVARQKSINFLREAGEDTSALDTELIDKQKDLAAAQDNHKKSLDKLEKAEKAVLPTTSSVVRSFGAIILATSAYGAAFSVANMVIQNGLIPTIGSLIDQLLGWQATATKTTTAMGDAAHQARGNYAAVLAQASANAGLSRGMMDFVSAAVEATVTAKAGARAQQETSNLYRTAMAGGPPEGLYGGYGGVLGSGLLAEQMGGGKGFTEIIAGDLLKGAGGLNLPLVGNLANAPEALNTAIQFLGSEDFRNTTMGQAKGLGIDTGIVGIAMDTIAEAGDALRGMDLTGMLPFDVAGIFGNGKDFISNFIGEATPPNEVPGVALGPERFVAPVLENLVDGGKNLQVYFDDLGAAAKRGAEAAGEAATGNFRLAKSAAEMQKAQGVAIAAGDINGVRMAQQGIVLEDAFGNVVTSTDQYQQIVEDMARGKNIVTSDVWAKQNLRQLQAQQQVNVAQTERQINIELPYDQMKQLLVSPILKPGASFFAAGMSGATAGAARTAIGGIPQLNQELQALASQGLAEARAQISQFNPEDLPKFDEASGMAQAASANIARFSNEMLRLNRIASQASWANQIRLANRALGDALGLLNRTGSTRMGQLQREEQMISRASTQLSLMLQQRQITTQVALAGFQAPGETGEERYMRQVERLAEADIAQQQLDLSKQNFSVSIQIWTENARRAATDAQKAINVMSAARNAEGYAIAAQERIAKEQQKLAIVVGRMDAIFGKARNSWNNALSAAAQGVGEFSGAVDDAIKEIYTALGYRQTRKGWVRNPRMESAGLMGSYSHGYLGAFARGATFTVGEAGPETVAILRNPRTHMLQGEGGSSGPSSVTVNINGPVVRGDDDITKLARAVAVEVERSLSKKGQLLGLRQPAY